MRILSLFCIAAMAAFGATAWAQQVGHDQALRQLTDADAQVRRAAVERLSEVGVMGDVSALLKSLRDTDEDVRQQAEQAIWQIWSRSGDREVDKLYENGLAQMQSGDVEQAIATFTRIIELKPDFAEGWNKRATLYFLVGDLHKSLADCDEVMKRNPYHWGALSGYAQIYTRLEYYDRALDYSRRALAINPNLEAVRQNIKLLEHVIEQRRKQMV
ncbi:MAG TPA: tetratricopeptide repeat protein [Casimicrobiaceae bacterium]|nr:tetratricopeptide repeat protein [Casimicrobiaceae bacterium]